MTDIKYKGHILKVEFGHYMGKRRAISLTCKEDGFPFSKATVNLPEYDRFYGEGFVFIKNYSENKGILEALIEHDIVEPPIETLSSSFIEKAAVYQINGEYEEGIFVTKLKGGN
ncbi:hypothetical protein NO1_1220 [Candidatus Termititenax aidoneus]|uniref:Uncharacterized protein n=1 Tax=Termititenax aidoneus TaxID=2218524 RepID=A0A388TCA1_TERA1|nr:hypothetical protein NO1_1220 [Candidatus Termititenax aidoneus]